MSTRQLHELGFNDSAIRRLVAAGRLHRLYRGVYAVGHTALPARGHWLAAVLALGPGAVLSHREAAALWGIRASSRSSIDVTARGRRRSRRHGIDVHVTLRLDRADRTVRERIPVTSVARTLLDLADVLDAHAVQRAYEEADRQQLLDLTPLRALLDRSNGRRGTGVIRRLLAYDPAAAAAAESELERLFLDLIREAGLPTPSVNVLVEGFLVDAYWPGARLVVELDGYEFHRDRRAFERDRLEVAKLRLAGYEVLPLTHRRLTEEPEWVLATLRALLRRGGSRDAEPRRSASL